MSFGSVPSTSTYDALTQYVVDKRMIDNIFVGRPTLQKLRENMKTFAGQGWQVILEYGSLTPEWFNSASSFTMTTSGDIAQRAQYVPYHMALTVVLPLLDIVGQGSEALVDMISAYMRNAMKSVSNWLSGQIINPATQTNAICALPVMCGDNRYERGTTALGGIDNNTASWWKPHIMEGSSDGSTNYGKAVSPTIENLAMMQREVSTTIGSPLNNAMWVVAPALWNVLVGQLTANDYALANKGLSGKNKEVFDWGFPAFSIEGVPVTYDRAMAVTGLSEAWVSGQATRAAAKGYQAILINWDHLELRYNPEISWKWQPQGWQDIYDKPLRYNRFYLSGNLSTDSRRAHGRIYNIDITQTSGNWAPATVTVPTTA